MLSATVTQRKPALPSPEDTLIATLRTLTQNIVGYAGKEGSFTASTEKDKKIKRVTGALARAQSEVAEQVALLLDSYGRTTPVMHTPSEYTAFNYMSYTAALPRVLTDLATRHAALQKTRNELVEVIRKLTDTCALVTAAKLVHEKAIEKLNVEAAGVTRPVAIEPDPPEIAPLVPTVHIIDVVEQVAVLATPGTPAPAADAHAPAHDAHAPAHGEAHAPAHAEAHAAPKAEPKAAAPKAEAAPASKAPEPAPAPAAEAAPEEKKAPTPEEEDAAFKATWTLASPGKLAGDKSNFALAAETDSADILTKLAKDTNHLVRHNVVQNPNTPQAIVEGLMGDPSYYVRTAAKQRLGR